MHVLVCLSCVCRRISFVLKTKQLVSRTYTYWAYLTFRTYFNAMCLWWVGKLSYRLFFQCSGVLVYEEGRVARVFARLTHLVVRNFRSGLGKPAIYLTIFLSWKSRCKFPQIKWFLSSNKTCFRHFPVQIVSIDVKSTNGCNEKHPTVFCAKETRSLPVFVNRNQKKH